MSDAKVSRRERLRKEGIENILNNLWYDELKHFKESMSEYDKLTFAEFKDEIQGHTLYDLICIKDCHIHFTLVELWKEMYPQSESKSESESESD
jgi:hypothetical protein